MPVIRCPHCGIGSDVGIAAMSDRRNHPDQVSAIGFCKLCNEDVWFILKKDNLNEVLGSYPPLTERTPTEIQNKGIQKAFDEALKCYGAQAWNGTLLMLRRTLHEAIRELSKDFEDKEDFLKIKQLPLQLKRLEDERLITPSLRDWADQSRIGGKLAAHGTGGDEWGAPEKEWGDKNDATEVLDFIKSFLEYALVLPKRLEERKNKLPAPQ